MSSASCICVHSGQTEKRSAYFIRPRTATIVDALTKEANPSAEFPDIDTLKAIMRQAVADELRTMPLQPVNAPMGGLSNQIFASTYTYVIPQKAKLVAQVEAVLKQWEDRTAD